MHLPSVGERAAHLPWLWPDAHSLQVLSEPLAPDTWDKLRRDPGALLLIVRQHSFTNSAFVSERLLEPGILESALNWFQQDRGSWIDWRRSSILPVYLTALAVAHRARIIARMTNSCDERMAWTAGLLAPLGWFAIAAVDVNALSECRSDPNFAANPNRAQCECWGLDHLAIARRLTHRWQLPDWLAGVVGHLDVPLADARALGIDPGLFATIQLAIVLAERAGFSLGLAPNAAASDATRQLGIGTEGLANVEECFLAEDLAEAFEPEWQDPREAADLTTAMRKAVEHRRAAAAPFLEPLERDLDRMHELLIGLRAGEEQRVQQEKLSALAEFAAGASHEINNPLAVISGQSQFLLKDDFTGPHRGALESIVRQTHRIDSILTELMQFARPPKINRQRVALNTVLSAVVEAFRGLANESGVTLDCILADPALALDVDPRHLQTAVGCLVRNAIEAAAIEKGWARLSARTRAGQVEIVVDDNGPGLTSLQREHMFDPFFSGRAAGRGRGLGLPTAWRLAREHGGDVRHEPSRGGMTRFVLSLPHSDAAERKIA